MEADKEENFWKHCNKIHQVIELKHDWKLIRNEYRDFWLDWKKQYHEKPTSNTPIPEAGILLISGLVSMILLKRKKIN